MLASVLTWLDATPTRYWSLAWSGFGLAVALAFVPFVGGGGRCWWRHPAWFAAAMLFSIFAFRWPVLCSNTQLADPDESQLMAGALTLRHDPFFWRSVDGTTHGPGAELPLLVPTVFGAALDFTTARCVSVLLAWLAPFAAAMVFRALFGEGVGRLLTLPLLAVHAFTHNWYFAQYGSEHVPAALLAIGCALLLTSWDAAGGNLRWPRCFAAGVMLGAVPFAKLQSAPIAAWALVAGAGLIAATSASDWSTRRRALGALAAGGATAPASIVGLVALAGLGTDFWQSYIVDNLRYAGERWFTWRETPAKLLELGGVAEGFNPFFLWLLGFGCCALLLLTRFSSWHRRCVLFAAGLLLAAIYATMAPGRMFMHYVQLLLFPAGLFGGLLAGVSATALRQAPGPVGPAGWRPAVVLAAFLGCGLLPQLIWRAGQDYPLLSRFRATHGQLVQSAAAHAILRHARAGERLAIWGWMPTFWVETGLIQGTRDGNCARQIEPSPQRDAYRARFLADLRRLNPPVFVDAVGGGNFAYGDRAASGHETFPELARTIAQGYRLVDDLDGTRVYVRNDRP